MEKYNIEEILNKYIGKSIEIKQEGFLQARYTITSLAHNTEEEILNITDNQTNNYLQINTNQIYKLEDQPNETQIYLDNDTTIKLGFLKTKA